MSDLIVLVTAEGDRFESSKSLLSALSAIFRGMFDVVGNDTEVQLPEATTAWRFVLDRIAGTSLDRPNVQLCTSGLLVADKYELLLVKPVLIAELTLVC